MSYCLRLSVQKLKHLTERHKPLASSKQEDEDNTDDEDDTAELLAELQKIKKERTAEKARMVGVYYLVYIYLVGVNKKKSSEFT